MKSGQKDKIWNILSYMYLAAVALAVIYSIAGVCARYPQNGFNSQSVISLTDGWKYSVDGSTPKAVTLPQTRNIPEAEDASITRTLPMDIEKGVSLAVYSSFQNIRVDIGGEQVLKYDGTKGLLYTNVPVTQILFISMKSSYAGQKITIHYGSPLGSRKGVMHEVFLGYRADIIYHMIRERIVIMLAGFLLILIGIVIICYRAFSGTSGVTGEALQYQGIYMLLMGIFFVLQTGMNQVFFRDLNWSRFLEFYSIMIIPAAYLLEIDAVEKHVFRRMADVICLVFIALSALEAYIVAFRHVDYMYINWITYIMFGVAILFAAGSFFFIAANDRELFHEMKWMVCAFISMGIGGVGEILLYYIDSDKEDCRMLACGVLAHFFFTMRWIMQEREILETKKERAVQQAEAKSSFLANMSHEIRTPVIAILGINDQIINDCHEEEILTYARDMHDAGKNLLGLINNILDYSKIESGRMETVQSRYELLPLLQGLAASTREAIGSRNVELSFEVDPRLPSALMGDEQKIRQILWNVLQNAAKYTDEGSVSMEVSGRIKDEGSIRLCFSVTDTGCGMNRDTRQRVFESFNHDYSSEMPGIGLGLSIAGNLARQMGGTMEVRSREGEGSQLTLWITQKIMNGAAVGQYHDEETAAGSEFEGARILAADDEDMNLDIIVKILQPLGITAALAHSGEEALDMSRREKYDALFLDYLMPGMDGAEVFERIRNDEQNPNHAVPAVMLTAGTDADTRSRCMEMGFADCLIKPADQAKLKQILRQLLSDGDPRQGRHG